ncbi:MAG: MFS transporter [Oscillospiraceae bacterium]|nr:MFS transporter [Oscillospiraceae bacterium]
MDKTMLRNKYCFGIGTVGRDAVYSLVSMYFITYLTEVVGLSDTYLAVIGGLMVAFRVFDALNDPIMGTIVDNTNTRWGKFKPWILFGMLSAGVLTVLLFSDPGLTGGAYVAFIAVIYLLWGMAFTTNDISYWSLMPAISKEQKIREGVGAVARICASVGMYAVVVLYTMVPSLFGTTPRKSYYLFALIIVAVMWFFQTFTLIGVREDRSELARQERTSLSGMVKALFKNDQLMVAAAAMALFMIGYCTTTSFGIYYFKYAYKNEGTYMLFAAVLGAAQLLALSIFPQFSKKFTRRQLYTGATIAVVIAYIVFFFSFEKLPLIIIAGLCLFFAQAFIQLLMLLFLADAVEYGEWKLGKRNESVSFAVQPFINKLGGAVGTAVVTVTLIVSGINDVSNRIAALDPVTDAEAITALINGVTGSPLWIMKLSMMILPLICIVAGYILYAKKFRIDEALYAQIVDELNSRK